MKGKCQWEGCKSRAKFAIYRINADGSKDWMHVCDIHDRLIAKINGQRRQDLTTYPTKL